MSNNSNSNSQATSSRTPGVPSRYLMPAEGTYYNVKSHGGHIASIQITNFTAKILKAIVCKDAEEEMSFEVEITFSGESKKVILTVSEFRKPGWWNSRGFAGAIVYPGTKHEEHLLAAIQTCSDPIPEVAMYRKIGWHRDESTSSDFYVHAGGIIRKSQSSQSPGNAGVASQASRASRICREITRAPSILADFSLPPSLSGVELLNAVDKAINFATCGDSATATIFCAVWASIIGDNNYMIHLFGNTGTLKTSIAAVAQQFFGPKMDAEHLPVNWNGTEKGIAAIAAEAKNALLVVDNYVPANDIKSAEAICRLAHLVGDHASRVKLGKDSQVNSSPKPEALILSTGEDLPSGQSSIGRIVAVEVTDGMVDKSRLKSCQMDASAGTYAALTASFIEWLAPNYAGFLEHKKENFDDFKPPPLSNGKVHPRIERATAHLTYGLSLFSNFLREIGVEKTNVDKCYKRILSNLLEAYQSQSLLYTDGGLAERFCHLIESAIASGAAYLTNSSTETPIESLCPQSLGWREVQTKTESSSSAFVNIMKEFTNKMKANQQSPSQQTTEQPSEKKAGDTSKTNTNATSTYDISATKMRYWNPRGECIGVIGALGEIYLYPLPALRVVMAASPRSQPFYATINMLAKALYAARKFRKTDINTPGRNTYCIRKTIGGRQRSVWCFEPGAIIDNVNTTGNQDFNSLI